MSSLVSVNTYSHSVTFVTDQMLRSLRSIISWTGLDPKHFVDDWATYERAVKTWLESQHLQTIVLEVTNTSGGLATRWDFSVDYGYGSGDGTMWADTQALKFAIAKAGVQPAECKYSISLITKPGRADVAGWGTGALLSTEGFVKQSVGTTIGTHAIGTSASYYRKA